MSQPITEVRVPIHPRSVRGRFRTLKTGILIVAYATYFLLPWLRWPREHGPDQAILFDIPNRRFYLFDLVVYPQDIFWLAGFLIVAAMLLFFVTGIAGRVFCGYFCFQTLWTDVFMRIERWVQGERPARLRLASAPWGWEKAAKLSATWALWLIVSFLTSLAFILYWGNAPDVVRWYFTGEAPAAAYITTAILTATTVLFAGVLREQTCTLLCPYARFQSVMFDRDTLIVSYDAKRGEGPAGRAKPTRGLKTRDERRAAGHGDCIDCGYCVQVCPTGIDIRDGLQVSCIHCALCIDACNTIMDKQGWPRGLIGYTSERSLQGERTRFLKGKTVGYGVAILVVATLLVASILTRSEIDVTVSQVRQPLYVQMSDGRTQNSYELKLNSKVQVPVPIRVEVEGLPEPELDFGMIGDVVLDPGQRLTVAMRIRHDPSLLDASPTPFTVVIRHAEDGRPLASAASQFSHR